MCAPFLCRTLRIPKAREVKKHKGGLAGSKRLNVTITQNKTRGNFLQRILLFQAAPTRHLTPRLLCRAVPAHPSHLRHLTVLFRAVLILVCQRL